MQVGDLVKVKPKYKGHRPDVVGVIVLIDKVMDSRPLALVRRADSDRHMWAYFCDMEVLSCRES